MKIMLYLILFIAAFFLVAVIIGYVLSSPAYKGALSDHFDGEEFANPGKVKARGFRDLVKWMTNRERGEWKTWQDQPYGEGPVKRVDDGIRITFVNHSTFLIQTEGLNILTDPIWEERASPFSWVGPKRMRPPGIKFEDLPPIDVVLISHNHYDHLDLPTLKKISLKHDPTIITPLGVQAFLEKENIKGSRDLDWWQEITLRDSLKVQAVPAQHFSGRGMFDRDATLWCGFVLKRNDGNIYFAGDTGYNTTTFKEIGERCAPMTVALIPIGAYKPGWFMSPIHCSPEEAVKIHQDVKANQSIGIHFGTFPLADDGQNDPVNDLRKALKANDLPENSFLVLKEGVAYDLHPANQVKSESEQF